jgi:hypothetical protein
LEKAENRREKASRTPRERLENALSSAKACGGDDRGGEWLLLAAGVSGVSGVGEASRGVGRAGFLEARRGAALDARRLG